MNKLFSYFLLFLVGLWLLLAVHLGVCMQIVSYLLLRPFSSRTHRKFMDMVQRSFLITLSFFLESGGNLRLEVSGDPIPPENALVLPNHLGHDWGHIYMIALRNGNLGAVRTVLKNATKYVPGFGLSMYLANWPFVSRGKKSSSSYLRKLFKSYREEDMPLVLWLFPEGTRRTPAKLKKSQEYARNRKPVPYPDFKHVMLPRFKGVQEAVNGLDGVVDYVYQATIAYSGWGKDGNKTPGAAELLFRDPEKEYTLHIHCQKTPLSAIPSGDDEKFKKYMLDTFHDKDQLMETYERTGHFHADAVVQDRLPTSTFALPILSWATITVGFIWTVSQYML